MIEWLMASVDVSRPHDVGFQLSWHARLMVLSWSVLLPLGVLWARYLKITPGQNWPEELDNKTWWYGHLIFQYAGVLLIIPALWLLWGREELPHQSGVHAYMGWTLVALAVCQVIGGLLRGSKGGPTEQQMRGAHFDMTPRRVFFEYFHKTLGYAALLLGFITTMSGLWQANAPRFMVISIGFWWIAIFAAFYWLQFKLKAYDTYQAIWGPSPEMPGNQRRPIGLFVYRPDDSRNR